MICAQSCSSLFQRYVWRSVCLLYACWKRFRTSGGPEREVCDKMENDAPPPPCVDIWEREDVAVPRQGGISFPASQKSLEMIVIVLG